MIEIVSWVFEILIAVGCLHKFYGRKLQVDLPLLLLIAYAVVILYGINYLNISLCLTLTVYVAIFIFSLHKFKNNITKTLTDCFLAAIISIILQLIYYFPIAIIVGNQSLYAKIGCILNILCFLTVIVGGEKFHLSAVAEFAEKRDYLTYVCIGCVAIYLFFNIYRLRLTHYWSGIRFLEILIWLLLIVVMWFQVQKNRKEKENKEHQLQKQNEYMQSFERQLYVVRMKQHDMKNHLNAFCGMTEEISDDRELSEMQRKYREYILEDKEYKRIVQGGNPVITGFLNKKIKEIEQLGIEFQYELAYISLDSAISIYEWIEVVGILLDNAVDAVQEQPIGSRKIWMELQQTVNEINLRVANVSRYINSEESTHFFDAGYTTKGKERGIGLSKLKTIVCEREGAILVQNVQREDLNCIEFSIHINNYIGK